MRAAVLVLALLLAPAIARAESEAERLYHEGQAAYDDGRYDDALDAWEESYALSSLPALRFNIAQALRRRDQPGDCARARAEYQAFVDAAPASPQRTQAESFVEELAACAAPEPEPARPLPEAPPPPPDRSPSQALRLGSYAVGATAAALLVGGVLFGLEARRLDADVRDACRDGCMWEDVADADAYGRRAERIQYVLYGTGGAALAAGAVMWLRWSGTW